MIIFLQNKALGHSVSIIIRVVLNKFGWRVDADGGEKEGRKERTAEGGPCS